MDLGLGGMGGGLGGMGGGMGGMGGGMGGLGGLGDFGADSLPPELQRALRHLEGMDQRLGKLSLPILKQQYECGFKRCIQSGSSSNMMSSWGSTSSSSDNNSSAQDPTLSCIEKCEQPMQEFSQACETRMQGLVERMTQCFSGPDMNSGAGSDNSGVETCIANALDERAILEVERGVKSDVDGICAKFSTL